MIEIQNVKLAKMLFSLFFLLSWLCLPSSAVADALPTVNVTVEGVTLEMPVLPRIVNDRTLIGVRFVGEAVGATVNWNQQSHQALITRGNDTVLLTLGSTEAIVNGVPVIMEVPAQLIEERTMVPLRFLAEVLGGTVEWDPQTRTANILRKPSIITGMSYSRDSGQTKVTLTFSEPLISVAPEPNARAVAFNLYPAVIGIEEPFKWIFDTMLQMIHLQAEGRTVTFQAGTWNAPLHTYSLSPQGTELVIHFPHIVTGVQFHQDGRLPLVSIAANGKLNYTVTDSPDSNSLVLDIAGTQLADGLPIVIPVGAPYLTQVTTEEITKGSNSVRVVLELTRQVAYEIVSTEFGLQVQFIPQIDAVQTDQLDGRTRLTFAGTLPMDAQVTVLEWQRQLRIEVPQSRSGLKENLIKVTDGTIDTISVQPGAAPGSTLITVTLPYYLGHSLISRPGDSHITVDVITSPIYGKHIWVDAGHGKIPGGKDDPGAIGLTTGLMEKDVNLQVSLKLQRLLQDAGAIVLMTRTGDEGIDFTERAQLVNASTPPIDLFISIHHNAATNGETRGTETYYWTTNPKSREIAEMLHRGILTGLGFPDRKVRWEPFKVIRDTLAPAVLLELGYLSSPDEEQALNKPTYPVKAAEAIKNGIFDYFWQDFRPPVAN